MRVFRSEWIKLSRRNTMLGFGGAIVGFVLLATVMMFTSAGGADVGLDQDDFVPAAALSQSDGAVFPITEITILLGVISLALFATNFAGEFQRGTIRLLFVTEPNRLKILAGKIAALSSFVGLWVGAALVVSVAAGALIPSTGVNTTSWWTTDGLAAMGSAYLSVTAACLVGGLLGAALAVATRSSSISISIGTVYLIIVEPLGAMFWRPLAEWGPAAVLSALPVADEAGLTHATIWILALAYSVVSLSGAALTLANRDVTS